MKKHVMKIAIPELYSQRSKEEKEAIKKYHETGDRSEVDKLGIKFVKPL